MILYNLFKYLYHDTQTYTKDASSALYTETEDISFCQPSVVLLHGH